MSRKTNIKLLQKEKVTTYIFLYIICVYVCIYVCMYMYMYKYCQNKMFIKMHGNVMEPWFTTVNIT